MSESSGVPNSLSSGSAVAAAEGPFAPSRQAPRNNSASTREVQNRGSRGGRSINSRANAGRGNNSNGRDGPSPAASQQGSTGDDESHRNKPRNRPRQRQQQDDHKPPDASRRHGNSMRGRGRGRSRRGGLGGSHGKTAGRAAAPPGQEESEDGERPLCIVCAEELVYFAVGECNHSGRCSKCAMRSRMLLKDQSCPECKTRLDRLVVTKLPASGEPLRFESFNLWGDFAGPDAEFDEGSGMIFQSCASHLEHLVHARELRCPVGGCKRRNAGDDDVGKIEREDGGRPFLAKEALVDHMKSAHQRFFCGVCLESRPLFVSEQEVFHGIAALRKHESRPDGGHPLCRFCSRRFFDNVALYEHMTGTHINCHLCPEEHQHRYFRGEPQLRDHLRTSHFLCDRDYCRRRGVVSAFTTPQELQAHLAEEHGLTDHHRGTAAVGFTIRRAARDGSGVAGAAAGSQHDASHGGSATLDHHGTESFAAPDPVADLSEGVVVIAPGGRRNAGIPSLGGGSGRSSGGGGGAGGWAEVTGRSSPSVQEAFPSLPTASSRPRPLQERHAFSLVGRRSRPDRAGPGSVAGAAVPSERAGADKDRTSKGENEVLLRNKRLAEALGIRLGAGAAVGGAKVGTTAEGTAVAMGLGDGLDVIREHLERTNYSIFLVSWARANRSELLKLERRLADLVADRRGTSTQLKPMPADHRRAVHELAVHYGLVTQSYDLEPKRYVSAIKQQGCRIPTRLLSVAARDPSYKGTDDVPPDAPLATAGNEPAVLRHALSAAGVLSSLSAAAPPFVSSSLAPEKSPVSPSPPSAGTPGTARVTSISSSANPPSNQSREAGVASSKAPHQSKKDGQGQRRTAAASSRPLLPQPRPQQLVAQRDAAERRLPPGFEDIGNAGNNVPLSSAATASTSQEEHHHPQPQSRSGGVGGGPPPENLLVFHSLKAGLWGEGVLEAVGELVPARTVLGFRTATVSEASSAGVTGRVGVVEFSSEVNARRAREKIEKDADQLIAAARVTRADYHPPFRTLPYPSTTSTSIPTPVKANDASAIEALSVRDNWDSSDDEVDVHESVEGQREGDDAYAAVSGEVVDVAGPEREGGFSEVEDVSSSRVEEVSSGGMAAGSDEERRGAMTPQKDARVSEASISTSTADAFVEAGEGAEEENMNGDAATAVSVGDVEKFEGKGRGGATKGSAHPSGIGVGSVPERRSSKWGNSMIRGRLSRPSDGRVPTVEQEASERKEHLEKLRRLEEERRESRKQKRDVEKREGRRGTGNPDAHAFVWETLAESSSEEESSASEQPECSEASKDSQQQGPQEGQGHDFLQQEAEGGSSSPSPAECSRLETLETQGAKTSGWACEKCTLWNDFYAEEHRGDRGPGDGERPRCAVCEAEAPRNVGLPWSTA